MKTAPLDALARSLTGPFAFCGIAACHAGQTHYAISTTEGVVVDRDTMFRVASISKIITGAVFEAAAQGAGFDRPYDVDARDILPIDLRHPLFPDQPVTLGMLLTHTSGLWDDGGYVFDKMLSDSFAPTTMFGPQAPGTYFRYSNLGYLLLAAAAEKIAGVRFDQFAQTEALSVHGLKGGFNWAGVSAGGRVGAVPTYRRGTDGFIPQIDMQPVRAPVVTDYLLGEHTGRFSPQGGFRMSLSGMLGLAQILIGAGDTPLWRQQDGPGDYADGLMQHYGAGLQFLDTPPFYPRPLVGHFANAYGFKGGVWCDDTNDIAFAYALNGAEMGDESDALSAAEQQIFAAISQI